MAIEFKLKCRAAVDELVVEAWIAEVMSGGEDWLRASELLAAYGYGKPAQSVTVAGDPKNPVRHVYDLRVATDDELDVLERVLSRGEVAEASASEPN